MGPRGSERPRTDGGPKRDRGSRLLGERREQPVLVSAPPITPDGRYIVVRGRLWRRANPELTEERRQELVNALMDARRAVGRALRSDRGALPGAGAAVNAVKIALGERGPVWWTDGAPDLTSRMARTTAYADWFAEAAGRGEQPPRVRASGRRDP